MSFPSSCTWRWRTFPACLLLAVLSLSSSVAAQEGVSVCRPGVQLEAQALPVDKLLVMVKGKVPEEAILSTLARYPSWPTITPEDLASLKKEEAPDSLLKALAGGNPVYIGWSVIPPKVLRDNYGRYVRDKYFGIDVALANRSADKGLFVTAFEFCRQDLKEVSADPALVRGSLVKGEMTGRRSILLHLIHGTALVLAPVQGFFSNQARHDNFVTGVSILKPLETGFELVWPDTIQTYLDIWDKDEVFKKGFIVAAGAPPVRGRIFIPIDLIFPCPATAAPATESCAKQRAARKGRYSPEEVKKQIGTLVVLGQDIELKGQRRLLGQ